MDEMTRTESEVMRTIKSRWELVRKRYGEGINFTQSDDPINWIQEAIEEAADQLQYLVALKMALEEKAKND